MRYLECRMRNTSKDEATVEINHSIPPIPEDNLRLWLHTAPLHISDIHNSNDFLQSNSRLEDVILHAATQSTKADGHETRQLNGCDNIGVPEKCKRQKRPRSTQDHNLNERLRRKKLTEKMTALQQMIPNSVKRDQASTIDDAIKYIKTLQSQVQMMSAEAAHTILHSPVVMVPQLGQRGIQIPNLAPPVALATSENGACLGMSTLLPYPIGLSNQWLAQSAAIGPGLATAHSIQSNPAQLLEPIYAEDDIPCFVSQDAAIRRVSKYS